MHHHRLRQAKLLAATSLSLLLGAGTALAISTSTAAGAASTNADTLFGNSAPAASAWPDSNSVEVGVKFTSSVAGSVTGVRFYKGSGNSGTHVGSLFTASGRLLAHATFSNETASGWQSVSFAKAVAITAGTEYVAAYLAPHGHYAVTVGGLSNSVVAGPLTAIGNRVSADGLYSYSRTSTFPTSSYESDNYWVDPMFVPARTPATSTTTGTTTTGSTTSVPSSAAPVTTSPTKTTPAATTPTTTRPVKTRPVTTTPVTTTPTTTTPTTTTPATTTPTTTTPATTTQTTTTQTTTTPVTTTTTTTTTTPSGDCFASPGGCGYPDPSYAWSTSSAWQSGGGGVGPNNGTTATACSSLPSSGSITTSSSGQVIQNLNVTGTITVNKSNVTIKNVCVTTNGDAQLGSDAVKVLASGTTIEDSTLSGANASTGSIEQAVTNFGGGVVTISHDYIYDCGECLNTGGWNVSDSYILNNGMYGTNDHLEAVYVDGSGSEHVTIDHSTLLSPPGWDGAGSPNGGQAGLLFGDTDGGRGGSCSTQWDITNNLMAGDGVLIYECGNASSVGSASLTFTGNRIASCEGATTKDSQGYTECKDITAQNGDGTNRGGDGYGYYPLGALKQADMATYCSASTTNWSGNVSENTGAAYGC